MTPELERLKSWCLLHNIPWNSQTESRFDAYLRLLQTYQKQTNLIGDDDPNFIVDELFIDSLQILRTGSLGQSMLDVGTGAGFPAFPIKIVYPNIKMFLVEPRTKRYAFLQMAARELGLEKMHSYKSCIESVPVTHVDLVISKAFAPILKWIDIARPWAELGAQVACLVSQNDWNRAIPQINKIYKTSALIQSRDRVYARCLLLSTHDPFTLA